MKFTGEKKHRIILYLLEKINQNQCDNLAKKVSQEFDITATAVYKYLKELQQDNIINNPKRGVYELVSTTKEFELYRSQNEIVDDMLIYQETIYEFVKDLNKNVKSIWSYAFSEMINNVIDHSECEKLHITIMQNYLETLVIISDDGVGIFEKIKKHFNFHTPEESICELFKGKLTTDKENHSGEGIFFTSRMMDEFLIISSGKFFAINKFDDKLLKERNCSKGTLLIMKLSNFTNKTAKEIFDLYVDEDDGFNKTTIPLKNIFDADPVSRSQAKRVCNRLASFKEVRFDFSGIEWMGQGFADQIFRVFQNDNPTVKLTPVNMCDDVEAMYKHVVRG